jgi:hypothetical protein
MIIPVELSLGAQRALHALACEKFSTTQPSEDQLHTTFHCLIQVALKHTQRSLAAETSGIQKTLPTLTPSEPITSGYLSAPQQL